ncbi:MAG: phosphatidylserine decarboxylase [Elusimicrobiales bacterium]|jgi:phosphatidylserine decarboxylase|nr:phosphatidylserine decarboxylase [Elusimicrobiales bacterium]
MKIAKDGFLVLMISIVGLLLSIYALRFSKLYIILAFIFFVFFLFSLYFFRDPKRDYSFADYEIASPADGTVLSIKKESSDDVVVMRIFLSIFNVHLQRSPISGTVKNTKFTYGKFHVAYKPEAKDNQRNIIEIDGGNGRWANVEQITGAIARRIACYVKPSDNVKTGQKIGMIYFGSQVALYLPKDVEIKVKIGDKVEAGKTVVALWKKK